MVLSTAERNKRKRERKKKEKQQQQQQQQQLQQQEKNQELDEEKEDDHNDNDIEIVYVAEEIQLPVDAFADVIRVQQLAAIVSDDDTKKNHHRSGDDTGKDKDETDEEDEEDENHEEILTSKRKLRELLRPSVAELKRRVQRPDLVEAHDVTAGDPDFLITLKAIPGTVPVPRHWGRKRKYLQGKRGFEKPAFQLPEFIVNTGITEVRDTAAQQENEMSAKQKNRMRVAPKMGAIDVDYKVLYAAFFKHQTKPKYLTRFGELYYEGKELEAKINVKPGWPYSKRLREALGMISETASPPWLINMQRFGPPPSYPGLKFHGLNAPLPSPDCQYGYHPGGWGKPPLDPYGRPAFGGNPFDPPGSHFNHSPVDLGSTLVTSDGKILNKSDWGALPVGDVAQVGDDEQDEEESDEEESDSEMEDSEGEESTVVNASGMESMLPPPPMTATAPKDLRKQVPAGDETPFSINSELPKQLYRVIEQTTANQQAGALFASDVAYVVPGASNVPEGAESVISKAIAPGEMKQRISRENDDDDDDADLEKKFKF